VFPKLSQVRVLYISLDDKFVFSSVESSLAGVAKRLMQTNIRIGLDVFPTSCTDNWIDLESVPNDLSNYPVLSRVRDIAFGMPRPDIVASSAIPKWLALFPLLEHVEFLDELNDLSRKAKITLLRRIVQECAGIRSAKIDKETRDVAAWLAEVESSWYVVIELIMWNARRHAEMDSENWSVCGQLMTVLLVNKRRRGQKNEDTHDFREPKLQIRTMCCQRCHEIGIDPSPTFSFESGRTSQIISSEKMNCYNRTRINTCLAGPFIPHHQPISLCHSRSTSTASMTRRQCLNLMPITAFSSIKTCASTRIKTGQSTSLSGT
jgi:hypothetical protein